MRLRFDLYKQVQGRLQWTSIVLLALGGVIIAGGSLSGWLGLLMIFMTDGGLWERRAGVFLAVFTGLFPFGIGAVMIWRGVVRRRELRTLRDLGALARQTPAFSTEDVARTLDVGPARAHRVVLDALTKGILEDAPLPPAHSPTATTDPLAHTVASTPPGPPAPNPQVPFPPPAPLPLSPASPATSFVGSVLNATYRIEGQLGAGGMGMVFQARHLRTGRSYAVKTLLPEMRFSPDLVRRFEREATAASALGHPNIISVHDFNVTPDGTYYLVMDLLEGETLEARLSRVGSFAWQDARALILEIGAALVAAHEHGLLHRDVKPANVFLARAGGKERAVLLDFGLVKPISGADGRESAAVSRITATGAAVGTPLYMSPEQARGEVVDARSDQYSLAAVLFEVVTGAPPFLDRTLANVYAQLLTQEAPTASSVAEKPIPPSLDAVLARGLAKSKEARFSDVRAFLGAVEHVRATGTEAISRVSLGLRR